jgi:hypothetical protein
MPPKKTATEWIQFFATIISPFLLAWVGFASSQIKDRVKEQADAQQRAIARQDQLQKEAQEHQDKLIARQDELLAKEFAASGTRFDHTQKIFSDLTAADVGKKRLAVLAALAFVQERQIPEFLLSVLAITESNDAEVTAYLRQGLTELTLSESAPPSMRTAATRALSLLVPPDEVAKLQQGGTNNQVLRANVQAVTEVAATLATQSSSTASTQDEQKRARNQLQQLAPTLAVVAVSSSDDLTKAQAASSLEKAPVGDSVRVEQAIASLASNLSGEAQSAIKPRVYLHIADEKQRLKAEEFKQALIKRGNLVPGIQNVAGKGYIPDTLEVRYFAEDSKGYAENILNMLKEKGVVGRVSYVVPSASDLKISPDIRTHFEVWASRNSP